MNKISKMLLFATKHQSNKYSIWYLQRTVTGQSSQKTIWSRKNAKIQLWLFTAKGFILPTFCNKLSFPVLSAIFQYKTGLTSFCSVSSSIWYIREPWRLSGSDFYKPDATSVTEPGLSEWTANSIPTTKKSPMVITSVDTKHTER